MITGTGFLCGVLLFVYTKTGVSLNSLDWQRQLDLASGKICCLPMSFYSLSNGVQI